jgi:hypothetical protein
VDKKEEFVVSYSTLFTVVSKSSNGEYGFAIDHDAYSSVIRPPNPAKADH